MGIVSGMFGWIQHPYIETEKNIKDYFAFLALIVIGAFLWSRVIKQLVEN